MNFNEVIFILTFIIMAHFAPYDKNYRAQKRIQGEDVFGNKIKVLSPSVRHYSGRKIKNGDNSFASGASNFPPPPGFSNQDYGRNNFGGGLGQATSSSNRRFPQELPGHVQPEKMFRPIRGMGMSNTSPMEVSYDQVWGGRGRSNERRPKTPQEQQSQMACALPSRVHKISSSSDYGDDGKNYFVGEHSTKQNQTAQPVDLIISNLDHTMEVKELKRLLTNMIKEYAMILNINVIVQADGSPIAIVRVNSSQEAQFTISQLHRQKLGYKRIVISYAQNNQPNPEHLKVMVISILQEVPDKSMPLFKFIELLEARYHCTVSVSEVNKLKDVCKISDELGSRIISLTQEVKMSPPPSITGTLLPYCVFHCPNGLQNRGWCELNVVQTPSVRFSFKIFSAKLMALLNMHLGSFPLLSFQICYESEFHEPLPVDDSGVPLEHLITCVQNVEIQYSGPNKNIKIIKHEVNHTDEEETVLKTVAPPLAPHINLLCRELVDLLKTTDKCQLLLTKFIPAYHHHFGRQCRVADYGYTKLLELFESISHVVQIMGDGTRRVITLTHQAQMRRFTSDLLRVLKVQPSKQISVTEFPVAYEKVMNRTFNAVEYGLCNFEDLLSEVPENTIVVNQVDDEIVISVPKREQTAEEIMRTKQFASEVIDLLRHSPYYTMLFNKFVPAYHHHFGHQCKVSDYGFAKLIELFESIPDVVKIEELSDGERTVSLTIEQALKVLGSQLLQIIKVAKSPVRLEEVPLLYFREYGYPFKCQLFNCESVAEVVEKLPNYVQVIHSNAGPLLVAVDMDTIPNILRVRSWALLLNTPHTKELPQFKSEYHTCYGTSFSMEALYGIEDVIKVENGFASLTPLFIIAAQIYHIICNNGGSVHFSDLDKIYENSYGKPLRHAGYNLHSIDAFYKHFSLFFYVRGSKKKCAIVLDRNLPEHLIPLQSLYTQRNSSKNQNQHQEEMQWPPPPPPEMVQNVKKVSPPKPDTPPTPTEAAWNNWNTPIKFNSSMNLSIQMPILHNPCLMGDPNSLISPARHLLSNSRNPWGTMMPIVSAPDPTELPMPDKLLSKDGIPDDSTDSGVNIRLENSQSDTEVNSSASESQYNGLKKPYFGTFLKF